MLTGKQDGNTHCGRLAGFHYEVTRLNRGVLQIARMTKIGKSATSLEIWRTKVAGTHKALQHRGMMCFHPSSIHFLEFDEKTAIVSASLIPESKHFKLPSSSLAPKEARPKSQQLWLCSQRSLVDGMAHVEYHMSILGHTSKVS